MNGLIEYQDPYAIPQDAMRIQGGGVQYTPTAMEQAIASGNAERANNIVANTGGLTLDEAGVQAAGAGNKQYDAWKVQNTKYNTFLDSIQEPWKKEFYKQYVPQNDREYGNVQWKSNADGTWTALKSQAPGGSFETARQWLIDNPATDDWYKWTVDPNDVSKAGSTYEQYDAYGTQANTYAPYFLAAGTLLTGGLLAPVIAGAGLAGGAAIGAGMGAATSIGSQALANSGEVKDWGKVGMGIGTGALGGAVAGAGGLGNLFGGRGSEFTMTPDTAAAYAMEQYPSGWEGSIYGSPEGLINSTGSLDGLVGIGDGLVNPEEYYAEAMNYQPGPGEDALAQQVSGTNMTSLVKKVGLQTAKKLLSSMSSKPTAATNAQGTAAGSLSGLGSLMASLGGSSASRATPTMDIDQKLLAYKQAQIDPEYWRFMSNDQEA